MAPRALAPARGKEGPGDRCMGVLIIAPVKTEALKLAMAAVTRRPRALLIARRLLLLTRLRALAGEPTKVGPPKAPSRPPGPK